VFARGALRLASDAKAYAEVSASSHRIEYRAGPTPVAPFATQNFTPFVLPPSSPYYPTALGLSGGLDLFYRTLPLGGRVSRV